MSEVCQFVLHKIHNFVLSTSPSGTTRVLRSGTYLYEIICYGEHMPRPNLTITNNHWIFLTACERPTQSLELLCIDPLIWRKPGVKASIHFFQTLSMLSYFAETIKNRSNRKVFKYSLYIVIYSQLYLGESHIFPFFSFLFWNKYPRDLGRHFVKFDSQSLRLLGS